MDILCFSIFNHLRDCIEKRDILRDVSVKAVQFR